MQVCFYGSNISVLIPENRFRKRYYVQMFTGVFDYDFLCYRSRTHNCCVNMMNHIHKRLWQCVTKRSLDNLTMPFFDCKKIGAIALYRSVDRECIIEFSFMYSVHI